MSPSSGAMLTVPRPIPLPPDSNKVQPDNPVPKPQGRNKSSPGTETIAAFAVPEPAVDDALVEDVLMAVGAFDEAVDSGVLASPVEPAADAGLLGVVSTASSEEGNGESAVGAVVKASAVAPASIEEFEPSPDSAVVSVPLGDAGASSVAEDVETDVSVGVADEEIADDDGLTVEEADDVSASVESAELPPEVSAPTSPVPVPLESPGPLPPPSDDSAVSTGTAKNGEIVDSWDNSSSSSESSFCEDAEDWESPDDSVLDDCDSLAVSLAMSSVDSEDVNGVYPLVPSSGTVSGGMVVSPISASIPTAWAITEIGSAAVCPSTPAMTASVTPPG
ncbi:MAG: hypothetical protein LC104_05990 [Bacteroidales bacterium]|nr:hypothetical protein [Bacteroidales bacterium]